MCSSNSFVYQASSNNSLVLLLGGAGCVAMAEQSLPGPVCTGGIESVWVVLVLVFRKSAAASVGHVCRDLQKISILDPTIHREIQQQAVVYTKYMIHHTRACSQYLTKPDHFCDTGQQ